MFAYWWMILIVILVGVAWGLVWLLCFGFDLWYWLGLYGLVIVFWVSGLLSFFGCGCFVLFSFCVVLLVVCFWLDWLFRCVLVWFGCVLYLLSWWLPVGGFHCWGLFWFGLVWLLVWIVVLWLCADEFVLGVLIICNSYRLASLIFW